MNENISMPYSAEAECAVLGAVLFDPSQITLVAENLPENGSFYIEANGAIYSAMLELFRKGVPIDPVTLKDQLVKNGTFDAIGGISYIADMLQAVVTTANLPYYIKVVSDKSMLRKLIRACGEITTNCVGETHEVDYVLDNAEQKIFDIVQKRSENGIVKVGEIIPSAMERIQELSKRQEKVTGISTGLRDLDIKLSGLQNSDLVLIAARPAMGKSSLALNIGQYAAIHKNVPTAYFTLEMSKEQIVTRMLCSEALVDNSRIKSGELDRKDWENLFNASKLMVDAPFFIDDNSAASINDIRATCKRLKMKENLGLIIIDYLQLMEGTRNESRQQEVSDISRALKIMAKELNVPVIALSQLSRATDQRTDHRPNLSDLRESGAIEQDADIVMFIYRDEVYNPDTEDKNIAECIIRKHRNGETGTVKMCWLGRYTRFCDMEQTADGY